MNKQQAREARERCEAATEGPWRWMRDGCRVVTAHSRPSIGNPRIAADIPVGHRRESDLVGDGSFIAHSRTDLPDALDMLDKAMKMLREIYREDGVINATPETAQKARALLGEWEKKE